MCEKNLMCSCKVKLCIHTKTQGWACGLNYTHNMLGLFKTNAKMTNQSLDDTIDHESQCRFMRVSNMYVLDWFFFPLTTKKRNGKKSIWRCSECLATYRWLIDVTLFLNRLPWASNKCNFYRYDLNKFLGRLNAFGKLTWKVTVFFI